MILRIYTDGACSNNPGPGGWACLFLLPEEVQVMSSSVNHTTNNRMELLAVIKALQYFVDKFCWMGFEKLEIYSDSAYVINAINLGWLEKWHSYGWKARKGQLVRNTDLWRKIYVLIKNINNFLEVETEFIKVAGHSGVEMNEIVDKAARGEVEKLLAEQAKSGG